MKSKKIVWAVDVVKKYRNAEVKHTIIIGDEPNCHYENDSDCFFHEYIKDWAEEEGGGLNNGYKCEWEAPYQKEIEFDTLQNVPAAMEVIREALRTDPGYREGWKANIAVAFQDRFDDYCKRIVGRNAAPDHIHQISNEAADNFLNQLTHKPTEE